MVLANAEVKDVDKSARAIHNALQDMNVRWSMKQKEIQVK